ncbi:Glycine cleavage system transcriptional repressor [Thauera sp. GDN1]|uniref:glycine cleavage system protein R n=1 Tax=Thauera sp. GDN1 TaxID=2944810 RepID=UPI002479302E|nr:ACT domain-containing protein [Thauera sp. GDN1]WEN43234.1 Glycine cleavage system transcriptional repressor [Thauera sp. GDN1]
MKTSLILTLVGPDRPGLVSAISARASQCGANWMESRLTQLAGQFAGVVRLEVDDAAFDTLEAALRGLESEGLRVAIARGGEPAAADVRRVCLDLVGHDRPGIVREISTVLARHGVSIKALETACESASMSGEVLFRARAELSVPLAADLARIGADLEALANELMVDLALDETPVAGATA